MLVRNALFRRVNLASLHRWVDLGELDGADGWDTRAWAEAMAPYFAEHGSLPTGPDARGPALLQIDTAPEDRPGFWTVRQVFDDPAGDHDWGFTAEVDLAASDAESAAVVRVLSVGLVEASDSAAGPSRR